MSKTLSALILAAFGAVAVNAHAASHAGGAPMAPEKAASAAKMAGEKKAEHKKGEHKKDHMDGAKKADATKPAPAAAPAAPAAPKKDEPKK